MEGPKEEGKNAAERRGAATASLIAGIRVGGGGSLPACTLKWGCGGRARGGASAPAAAGAGRSGSRRRSSRPSPPRWPPSAATARAS